MGLIKRANELQALVAAREELQFIGALLTEKEKGGHREPTSGSWVWGSPGQLPASKGSRDTPCVPFPSPIPHPPSFGKCAISLLMAREMEERRKEGTLSSTEFQRGRSWEGHWSLGYVGAG